jgi:hypothetical protein
LQGVGLPTQPQDITEEWNRHGIGARELAMHLVNASVCAKAATGNLADYKRRMPLSIQFVRMGANGGAICK